MGIREDLLSAAGKSEYVIIEDYHPKAKSIFFALGFEEKNGKLIIPTDKLRPIDDDPFKNYRNYRMKKTQKILGELFDEAAN